MNDPELIRRELERRRGIKRPRRSASWGDRLAVRLTTTAALQADLTRMQVRHDPPLHERGLA